MKDGKMRWRFMLRDASTKTIWWGLAACGTAEDAGEVSCTIASGNRIETFRFGETQSDKAAGPTRCGQCSPAPLDPHSSGRFSQIRF